MISVILCAAGSGSRAGFSENKVLRELNGLPVLSYSLSAFGEADEILIPCREEDEARIGVLLTPFPQARTVRGGETREESVWNALQEVRGDIVLIHDAARPFVTRETVRACIQSVQKYGSGVCSLPATDTTVLAKDGAVAAVPPRGTVFTVQTPQGFLSGELKHAFALAGGAVLGRGEFIVAAVALTAAWLGHIVGMAGRPVRATREIARRHRARTSASAYDALA